MKRTNKASQMGNDLRKQKHTQNKCNHEDLVPHAVFVDDMKEEAFLFEVCENCGENFLLMGSYPLTIC